MSEEKAEQPRVDPFSQWLEFCDTFTRSWAGAMSETVATETFADAMSQQMETGMDALALMRRQVGEMMEQYLQQISLPTRGEVLSLAERLTRIEMRVDDLDAKLDDVLDHLETIHRALTTEE
jgi:polyhydroxyalkanoate synthesis regulator phasin